jgi:hypothetical protein
MENVRPYPTSVPYTRIFARPGRLGSRHHPFKSIAQGHRPISIPRHCHLIRTWFPRFPSSRLQFSPCGFRCPMGAMNSLQAASQAIPVLTIPRPDVPVSTFLHRNPINRHRPKDVLAILAFSRMAPDSPFHPHFPPFLLRGILKTSVFIVQKVFVTFVVPRDGSSSTTARGIYAHAHRASLCDGTRNSKYWIHWKNAYRSYYCSTHLRSRERIPSRSGSS